MPSHSVGGLLHAICGFRPALEELSVEYLKYTGLGFLKIYSGCGSFLLFRLFPGAGLKPIKTRKMNFEKPEKFLTWER